jgi:hypothetical protein
MSRAADAFDALDHGGVGLVPIAQFEALCDELGEAGMTDADRAAHAEHLDPEGGGGGVGRAAFIAWYAEIVAGERPICVMSGVASGSDADDDGVAEEDTQEGRDMFDRVAEEAQTDFLAPSSVGALLQMVGKRCRPTDVAKHAVAWSGPEGRIEKEAFARWYAAWINSSEVSDDDEQGGGAQSAPAKRVLTARMELAGEQRCFPNEVPLDCTVDAMLPGVATLLDAVVCDIRLHLDLHPDPHDQLLYTGSLGIAYMFVKLASHEQERRQLYLDCARSLLEKCSVQQFGTAPVHSVLCGTAGLHTVAAIYYRCSAQPDSTAEHVSLLTSASTIQSASDTPASDEWLYGRAGFLHALILMNTVISPGTVAQTQIDALADVIIASGIASSDRCPLEFAWHGTRYLGAAHGLAGILHMLLHVDHAVMTYRQVLLGSLDFLVDQLQPFEVGDGGGGDGAGGSANMPVCADEAADKLVHFCHGASGCVYTFAKAYTVFGDARYLEAARSCAELSWRYGLLKKGAGICHGTSGSAYAQLCLFKLTGEELYLRRAHGMAHFMHHAAVRLACSQADNPFSLFEGLAGCACLLQDLLSPQHACFPLFEFGGIR